MMEQLWSQGKVWSYFNTNPIFCLRSKYLGVKEPGTACYPCIPYAPGKQFLQQGVPMRFEKSKGLLSGEWLSTGKLQNKIRRGASNVMDGIRRTRTDPVPERKSRSHTASDVTSHH